MSQFRVNSYQLLESKKWVPAGMISVDINWDTIRYKEVDLSAEERFDTKEEADDFFREWFTRNGDVEIIWL